jgi:serine peptidase DegS
MRSFGPIPLLVTAVAAGSAGALLTLSLSAPAPPRPDTCTQPRQEDRASHATTFADAVARATPAVVSIYAAHTPQGLPADSGPDPRPPHPPGPPSAARAARTTGLGAGVILTADGLILTNRHVVQSATGIRVVMTGGRVLAARVLGQDPDTDLAVLKVDATDLPTVPLGDPRVLRPGDVALAIGNPYGVGQSVTQGIVSAIGRSELGLTPIEDFIQTDAAINPGNSGGALINARGELIGINTAIYSETGTADGIGFAIPSDLAVAVAFTIAERGQVPRGWIGLRGRSVTPELAATFGLRAAAGILVSSTLPDSPAAQAGLRPGDVVTRVDEHPVQTPRDLLDAIAGVGPDQTVSLEVWRGSERLQTRTVTERRPIPAK